MSNDPKCPDCGGYRGLPRMLHDEEEPRECANPFQPEPAPPVVEDEPEPARGPQLVDSTPGTTIPKPVCPYCGVEGKIHGNMTQMGPINVMVVRCGNNECRKVLGCFQPLMFEQQQMMPMPAGPPV